MSNIDLIINDIKDNKCESTFEKLYLDKQLIRYNKERYIEAINRYRDIFGDNEVQIYSAPGRSEVCGNHTDHQNGHVLAAAINLDAIAIVSPNIEKEIKLISDNSPVISVDLNNLEIIEAEKNTTESLIRGVANGISKMGYNIGGFDAYVTSDVLIGAGMSSSAAFESLIGAIFSGLYNNGKISSVEIAKIGQYAENAYFGKPCGLMDQMASSVGGLVYIDFSVKDNIMLESVPCDLAKAGYSLCIIDTHGSHADLTDEYAAIPNEMKKVAAYYDKKVLREVDSELFYKEIRKLRKHFSDRAILRSMHFFEEQKRVLKCVNCLKNNDFEGFLNGISESGDSSFKLLQNIYSQKDVVEQNMNIALAMSNHILGENGVCRVHGGGFAGTIQAFVKTGFVDEYKVKIEEVLGKGSCHILMIRGVGQTRVL